MPVDPAIPPTSDPALKLAQKVAALERKVATLESQLQGAVTGGVAVVSTLPTAGRAGRVVMLNSDKRLYRDNGTAWVVGA